MEKRPFSVPFCKIRMAFPAGWSANSDDEIDRLTGYAYHRFMLRSLVIHDFAIIDELTVQFAPGMAALTGETGAGKSIIIDALGLALGGRAFTEFIRSGADEARVEAMFDISRLPALKETLKSRDLGDDDDLIIRRTISKDGPNRISINGRMATVATLEEITRGLVDIYGQHEHHSLLRPETHLDILDAYGDLSGLRDEYANRWEAYCAIRRRIAELTKSEAERAARLDYLRFVVGEIEAADPKAGELDGLIAEREVLRNARMLIERTGIGYEKLYGDDNSIASRLKIIEESLREAAAADPKLLDPAQALESSRYAIEDAAYTLRDYSQRVADDPARLEEIEDRIEALNRLSKKYGGSIDAVMKFLQTSRAELEDLMGGGKSLEALHADSETALNAARSLAERLTAERRKAAEQLRKRIESELAELGMKRTRFDARFVPVGGDEGLSRWGAETIEFYIAPNPGEEVKPLVRIASGGELSRIMLAIKSVLRGGGEVPTLVFDEIDAGVGGAAAEVVGRKLRELSGRAQVLCVTHLPQIASFAHSHALVTKARKAGRTVTRITKLEEGERAEEVARMLGGIEVTDATRAVAAQMIERARRTT